ncbi:nucleotidyltransferase domain-containing protein [Aequorivita sinensis]|uniref:nucleotidyltransferase domain-containing protein n=1 Tax=Aequorivita sinensis TaxID=1382458 RepID=UPI002300597A|nr:nucleotidyltransferase [Aequorivita sinensis]
MPIIESQLSTWANQGSIKMSSKTYESVKNCIDSINWKPDITYDIYLQGSYKNSTNIYGNSDVDIVVEFTKIFSSSTSNLDDIGKEVHNALGPAKYTLEDFKASIVKKLESNYGKGNVDIGSKAIKIAGNLSRLDADVVVCNTYKKYHKNYGSRNLKATKGIIFTDSDNGDRIINYPKVHYDNGINKNEHKRTNGNYKSTVRIFRNIKASLVNSGIIGSGLAPSYFVECLIYNGKDECFRQSSYQQRVLCLLKQFVNDFKDNSVDNYVCQNEQRYLFGTGKQQWSKSEAKNFLAEVIKLWEN